jgi:hypothetical protein
MPTYKKHFRRKIKTVKKKLISHIHKKPRNKVKNHINVLVCYKIHIDKSKKKNGGAKVVTQPAKDRLNAMLKDIDEDKSIHNKDTFLQFIPSDSDNIKKKEEKLNAIFDENVYDRDKKKNDKKVQLLDYLVSGYYTREDLTVDPKIFEQYTQDTWKPVDDNEKLKITTQQNIENKNKLVEILRRKAAAQQIIDNVKQNLKNISFEDLSDKQKGTILASLENKNSGIGSTFASVKSSMLEGAVTLGHWFSPPIDSTDTGEKRILQNEQNVHFLWYPRKHTVYKKGDSTPTKRPDDGDEYGDFMIIVEPERFASTGEFFKQTYHSVEDLLATLLLGCNDMFCTKSGVNTDALWRNSVKRRPYNWRRYKIENTQPQKDYEYEKTKMQ